MLNTMENWRWCFLCILFVLSFVQLSDSMILEIIAKNKIMLVSGV